MVTDRERDIIDKAIGDEPPDYMRLTRVCRNCDNTYEEHHSVWMKVRWEDSLVRFDLCHDLHELLYEQDFEELTDDDIESMRADEEYSRRKDEGLL